MDSHLPGQLIFVFMILLEAVVSGFGTAVQNLNETELEHSMEEGDIQAGRILRIADRPGHFVLTVRLLTILGGITAGCAVIRCPAGAPPAFLKGAIPAGAAAAAGTVLSAAAAAVLLVSLGIIFPKRLALRKPEKWARRLIGPVRFLMALLFPLRLLSQGISALFLRLCGIAADGGQENVTEEDIMSMVNEGHEQGVVESDEAEMITNIFELNDKKAADIMTHRKNVAAMDGQMLLSDAADFLLNDGQNSRFPVYDGDIDNITGILTLRDALTAVRSGKYEGKKLSEVPGLLRKAYFIPESRALDSLFQEMQAGKIHLAVVVDEYGQTAGIVTMEDILEEIVGNITDEYDRDEELITALPDGSWIMKGATTLTEAEETAGIPFTEQEKEDFDTLSGFLIAGTDRIPEDGEHFTLKTHGYEFQILGVKNRVIRSVKVIWRENETVDAENTGC